MTVDPLRPASPGALFTDFYQLTMLQGYFDQHMDAMAVFEFFVAVCRAGAAITSPPGRCCGDILTLEEDAHEGRALIQPVMRRGASCRGGSECPADPALCTRTAYRHPSRRWSRTESAIRSRSPCLNWPHRQIGCIADQDSFSESLRPQRPFEPAPRSANPERPGRDTRRSAPLRKNPRGGRPARYRARRNPVPGRTGTTVRSRVRAGSLPARWAWRGHSRRTPSRNRSTHDNPCAAPVRPVAIRRGCSSAPTVPCTQCSGHSVCRP